MAKWDLLVFVASLSLLASACGSSDHLSSPPAAMCRTEVADASSPLIDDFEDGNNELLPSGNRHGSWYVSNDGTGIQAPAPTLDSDGQHPFLLSSPGSPQSPQFALRTVGWGFTGWGAFVSVNLNAPDNAPCAYDVSAFKGLKFQAKGSGNLRAGIGTLATTQVANGGQCTGNECSDFGAAVQLTDDWREVSIAFSDLNQPSWATPAEWSATDAVRLTYWVEQGDFDYWIDDVQFY